MYSTVHAHVDTCIFKREQVICSDNVWLSELMLVKRCGARVCRAPPWSILGFQTRFLVGTGGRYYPTAIREHTQDFHKKHTRFPEIFTRITLGSHRKSTRIPQGFHKITAQKTAEITSVSHAKTLEYVCHTGRTHEPPEISC